MKSNRIEKRTEKPAKSVDESIEAILDCMQSQDLKAQKAFVRLVQRYCDSQKIASVIENTSTAGFTEEESFVISEFLTFIQNLSNDTYEKLRFHQVP